MKNLHLNRVIQEKSPMMIMIVATEANMIHMKSGIQEKGVNIMYILKY